MGSLAGAYNRPVRKLLAIVLMLLLPLQALQAAGLVVCEPVVQGVSAAHDHDAPAAHAHHHDAHAGHDGHASVASDPVPDSGKDAGADRGQSADLHPCCHVAASLPVRHAGLALPAPAHLAPVPSALPALSHETSGPFRPPRRLPA